MFFPEADPATKIWMQVVYLGGDPRRAEEESGRTEKADIGCVREQVVALGSTLLETSGR